MTRTVRHQFERPVKVLHIFSRMDAGGAEMRTLDVMRHLDRDRYRLDFCTVSGRHGCLDDEIRRLGGKIHPLPLSLDFPSKFVRLLQRESYDVVHAHTYYAAGFFLRLARYAGTPLRIAHFRTTGDGKRPTIRRRLQAAWLRRWIDHHATHILAVSRSTMELAWRADWHADPRCRVVYNGIDTKYRQHETNGEEVRREFGIDAHVPLAIHVGNFSPDKNHRRVVSIFSEMARLQTGAHLLLVGDGGNELEARLRQHAAQLGLTQRITIAGRRADVPRLLAAADVMIFPSLREGLPGAVLEACSQGLPVLATDLPAVLEIKPHLPTLRAHSLQSSDSLWASSAWQLSARYTSRTARRAARAAFATSPFSIERATTAFCEIWASAASRLHRAPVRRAA